MKDSTKVLFIRPLLFQETITAVVVVPLLLFFFMNISEGVRVHFITAAMGALAAANFGLFLGVFVKYYLIRPALNLMENNSHTPDDIKHAVIRTSLLPFAESFTIFLRFALFGNLIAVLPMYLKGFVALEELMAGMFALVMIALLVMPFFYLASENSLAAFYMKFNMRGILDGEVRLFNVPINRKLLITVLLIAIPPFGLILDAICLSAVKGISLDSMKFGFVFLLLQTVILTVINGYLITRSLSLSVGKITLMLEEIARGHGDLAKRIHVTGLNEAGKLAFWFNSFMDDLELIVRDMNETSMQLRFAVQDVSNGSQHLSQSTQEQAASIEEISASIEEINSSIQNNAELVNDGRSTSQAITKDISVSRELFHELSRAISGISGYSKKISDIVVRVNEVAFQTNLLALNASVEAARAGEHGKGFSVVAAEVRALAQRSADAVKEIRSLIEETVGQIRTGDEMMTKTNESLEKMMSQLESFFSMMEIISNSSTEQANNIGELNRSISQIDLSTQQNASTVEELAGTMDNLRIMATLLAQDLKKFKIS
jgi:methyl-accepting chemotaxis protein